MIIAVSSCSGDEPAQTGPAQELLSRSTDDEPIGKDKGDSVFNLVRTPNAPMLEFETEKEYEVLLEEIEEAMDYEAKKAIVNSYFPNFKSLQDSYSDLIDKLDKLPSENSDSTRVSAYSGETIEGVQQQIREQHGSFYFPFIDGDAGPYLMVSDTDKAYLANINGDVKIAGEVVNCMDLKTYNDLTELGRSIAVVAMPQAAPAGASWFDCRKGKQIEKPKASPWNYFVLNNKCYKSMIDIRRQISKKWKMRTRYEVTFRKSTCFLCFSGWTNTKLESYFNVVEIDKYNSYSKTTRTSYYHKRGRSSHDFETLCYVLHDGKAPMIRWNRILPMKKATVTMTYRDDKQTFTDTYTFTLPARYNDRDESKRLDPYVIL